MIQSQVVVKLSSRVLEMKISIKILGVKMKEKLGLSLNFYFGERTFVRVSS